MRLLKSACLYNCIRMAKPKDVSCYILSLRMFQTKTYPNPESLYPLKRVLPTEGEKYEIFQKAYPLAMSWYEQKDADEDTVKAYNQKRFLQKFKYKKYTELVKHLKNFGRMRDSLDPLKQLQIKYSFKGENQVLRIPKLTNNQVSMSPTKFRHDFFKLENKAALVSCLNKHGIVEASKVQCKAIPVVMEGGHTFISSLSGSGKTLSYLIPLVDRILSCKATCGREVALSPDPSSHMTSANPSNKSFYERATEKMLSEFSYTETSLKSLPFIVIIVPTVILANQIKRNINEIFGELGVRAIVRNDIYNDRGVLDTASFFVTTPPSLLKCFDLFEMRPVYSVVLDEADVLMMDFPDYLDDFLNHQLIREKFTADSLPFIFASASLPEDNGVVFLETYFPDIKFVTQNHHIMAPNVDYKFVRVDQNKVYDQLLCDLKEFLTQGRSILVFTLSNKYANLVHAFLAENNVDSLLITADQKYMSKELCLLGKEFKIAVTSDVCSRGIHIDEVDTVINFNFPKHPTNFLHRIGRTARLGGHYTRHPLVLSYIVRKCDVYVANLIIQNYKATKGAIYNLPHYTF